MLHYVHRNESSSQRPPYFLEDEMSQDLNLFAFQRVIPVEADQIYRCFTSGPGFQEWLCRSAHISARPGGFLTLSWHSGYFTFGEYIRLEPNREILFTWHGRGEPQPTQVQVLLSPQGTSTQIELLHSCIGSEEIWAEPRKSIANGWEKSLQNLESVLTTGIDLRVVNRPAIGIHPIELNPELAAISGLPVSKGIYLTDVIPELSAAAAGLARGDVIVSIAGEDVKDLPTLVRILQSFQVGDQVQVGYYRGQSYLETTLAIQPLPVPDIPLAPEKLAAAARDLYAEVDQGLQACFRNLAEDAAGQKTDASWNAKEVLAHLIHTERDLHYAIQSAVVDQDFHWTDNTDARVRATLAAYPTCADLLKALRRAQAETIAFIESLPAEFVRRKSSFWQLGHTILTMKSHTQEHLGQIQRAIHHAQG